MAPTEYIDGSLLPLSDLGAYRIYHGTNADALGPVAEVDTGTTAFTVLDLGAGIHYFAVTAISIIGVESSFSEVGSKIIR
ncbi:MAG: hypothetical protein M3Y79_01310 [Pseudomonadota bacterium]|nr:hypothetical protein [Pseudomonadota bacterium]